MSALSDQCQRSDTIIQDFFISVCKCILQKRKKKQIASKKAHNSPAYLFIINIDMPIKP